MQIMGSVHLGLPSLAAIPKHYHIICIDIKDCSFSIPVHPEDSPGFSFSIPSLNNEGPNSRYQWVVLPQGMANSPTMCQIYVGQAISQSIQTCKELYCLHYMDDILLVIGNRRIYGGYLTILLKS